jgi:hypothetical protein
VSEPAVLSVVGKKCTDTQALDQVKSFQEMNEVNTNEMNILHCFSRMWLFSITNALFSKRCTTYHHVLIKETISKINPHSKEQLMSSIRSSAAKTNFERKELQSLSIGRTGYHKAYYTWNDTLLPALMQQCK